MAAECNANRVMFYFAGFGVEDLSVEDAWKAVEEADKEKEVDDIRKVSSELCLLRAVNKMLCYRTTLTLLQAILAYAKAFPEVTFEELESVFREAGMNTYLIAKEQAVSDTHTIVNLQGKIDQKYAISIQFGAKPRRAKFAEGWPDSPEENNARLTEAGFVMDRMVMKCSNCDRTYTSAIVWVLSPIHRANANPTTQNLGTDRRHALRRSVRGSSALSPAPTATKQATTRETAERRGRMGSVAARTAAPKITW